MVLTCNHTNISSEINLEFNSYFLSQAALMEDKR